jgi:hypothetical protein
LRIEYPLKANDQLQATLGYLLPSTHSLVVVEAKRDDLTRGFTQLAVEMIALALINPALKELYGAVKIGNLWIFGRLDQPTRTITQDIGSFTLPDDLADLVKVLVGILQGDQIAAARPYPSLAPAAGSI